MAFELKEGQGTLFKNDKKGNDKAPDYRGELSLAGEMFKIAGWLKDGKNGKWMSLKAEPKDQDARPARTSAPVARNDGPHDDIPF